MDEAMPRLWETPEVKLPEVPLDCVDEEVIVEIGSILSDTIV